MSGPRMWPPAVSVPRGGIVSSADVGGYRMVGLWPARTDISAIRVRCTDYSGAHWWRIYELEAYEQPNYAGANIFLTVAGTPFSSSNYSGGGEGPERAFDGNQSNTYWGAGGGGNTSNIGQFMGFRFAQTLDISRLRSVRFVPYSGHTANDWAFEIERAGAWETIPKGGAGVTSIPDVRTI